MLSSNPANEQRMATLRDQPSAYRSAARSSTAGRAALTVCSSATAAVDSPSSDASGALKGMLKFYFAYLLFGCAVNTIGAASRLAQGSPARLLTFAPSALPGRRTAARLAQPQASAHSDCACAAGPMLPSLAAHVGLTTVQMGPLLTAKGLGGLAGSFLSPLLPLARARRLSCPCRRLPRHPCEEAILLLLRFGIQFSFHS